VNAKPLTRDHWWWRPGWQPGRSFYTWHLTFSSAPEIAQIVSTFRPALTHFNTLDPVDEAGVHLTLQGVGFADEISTGDLEKIVAEVSSRCQTLSPILIQFEQPHVDEETVQMNVGPAGRLKQLRDFLRDGIGAACGPDRVPEDADIFRPHITLAYSKGICPIRDISQAVGALPIPARESSVSSVSLIRLNRDRQRYEWSDIATVSLMGGAR
jgi:2'-5' RNA ligase